jgi:hypothetical protein
MVLPIEGAPLVFSTSFAHDLVLHLNLPPAAANAKSPVKLNLPIVADAFQGGFTLDPNPSTRKELPLSPGDPDPITPQPAPGSAPDAMPAAAAAKTDAKTSLPGAPGAPITGTIEGYWGFDKYVGPTLPLQDVPGQGWHIVTGSASGGQTPNGDQAPDILIAGKPNHLQLAATGTACVESISLEPGDSKVEWKLDAPPPPPKASGVADAAPLAPPPVIPPVRPIDVTLNLQHAEKPGSIQLAIEQFGAKEPDHLGTKSFAEPARIESFILHAGDLTAILTGNSLAQVKDLTVEADKKTVTWTPATAPDGGQDRLTLTLARDMKAPNLKPNEKVNAEVHLEDGRVLETSTVVLPPRPAVTLLSRRYALPTPIPIQLASEDDLPLGAQLTFFLKSKEKFPRNEKIEIAQPESADATAAGDQPLKTTLSIAAGTLVLEDNHTILATFDPLKTFGPSTFGQFRLRAVSADGTEGEWIPLATIVRLPTLTGLQCPADATQSCLLSGSALYLIDAIATDAAFTAPTKVPEGFVDSTLAIPHVAGLPASGRSAGKAGTAASATFYLRLRDDPAAADAVTMPLTPEPGAPSSPRAKAPVAAPAAEPPVATPPSATPPPA